MKISFPFRISYEFWKLSNIRAVKNSDKSLLLYFVILNGEKQPHDASGCMTSGLWYCMASITAWEPSHHKEFWQLQNGIGESSQPVSHVTKLFLHLSTKIAELTAWRVVDLYYRFLDSFGHTRIPPYCDDLYLIALGCLWSCVITHSFFGFLFLILATNCPSGDILSCM